MACSSGHLYIRLQGGLTKVLFSPLDITLRWPAPARDWVNKTIALVIGPLSAIKSSIISDRPGLCGFVRRSWVLLFFLFLVGRSIFRLKESEQQQINLVWPNYPVIAANFTRGRLHSCNRYTVCDHTLLPETVRKLFWQSPILLILSCT